MADRLATLLLIQGLVAPWSAWATPAAQETVVYSFRAVGPTGLGDAAVPHSGLVLASDGNFYGTTFEGGANDNGVGGPGGDGTVYAITAAGSESVLYSFGTNATDGRNPEAPLIQASDDNLYGTTMFGGANDNNGQAFSGDGTFFQITPAGTYTQLHSFGASAGDSIHPTSALIEGSDGDLYGTTAEGGANGGGTIFKVTKTGVYTLLHSFSNHNNTPYAADGSIPGGALVLGDDGSLYGLAQEGGTRGFGTFFRLSASGAPTTLYAFGGCIADGTDPVGSLTKAPNGNFYGLTNAGGISPATGTAFVITPSGVEAVVHEFANPNGGLLYPRTPLRVGMDGNFYGVTSTGGTNDSSTGGDGTAFMFAPDGTFAELHSFGAAGDGIDPLGNLVQGADGGFYGVTAVGGGSNTGTVFKLSVSGTTPASYPTVTRATCESVPVGDTGSGELDVSLLCMLLSVPLARMRRKRPSRFDTK